MKVDKPLAAAATPERRFQQDPLPLRVFLILLGTAVVAVLIVALAVPGTTFRAGQLTGRRGQPGGLAWHRAAHGKTAGQRA